MRLHFAALAALAWMVLSPRLAAQTHGTTGLGDVYRDESHCLVAPEIRGPADNPVSCYCRDALADARYIYQTYLLTARDENLRGPYLVVEAHASEMCGKKYDVRKAAKGGSQWNGPEVTRTYPPDAVIEQLRPDRDGFRSVDYAVRLTFRDPQGHVTKVENFIARDLLPPSLKR
jgi:hypothetical protein